MKILNQEIKNNIFTLLLENDSIVSISLEIITDCELPFIESQEDNEINTLEIFKFDELIDDYYLNYIINKLIIEHIKKYLKIKIHLFDELNDKLILNSIKKILEFSELIKENNLIIKWENNKKIIFNNEIIYERELINNN